jgi:flagellar motor switch protein FliG
MAKQSEAKRNGTDRAAILLLSLGEQEAAEVMKHMGAKDVQRIGAAMTQLNNVSRQDVTAILGEFTQTVETRPRSASASTTTCARFSSARWVKTRRPA